MKIAFMVSSLAGGGAQRFVSNLATQYANNGHEVHIFLLLNKVIYELPATIAIHPLAETNRITPIKALNKLILARRFRRHIQEHAKHKPFDLIIATMFGANLVARLSGIPNIVYRISNNLDERLRKGRFIHLIKRAWMRRLFKGQRIMVLNREMQLHVNHTLDIPLDYITAIPLAFDFKSLMDKSMQLQEHLPNEPYIIHVGRYHDQKRHDVLLQAYKYSGIPHKLVLLGQGTPEWNKKIKKLIAELGLADKVIQPGFQINPYPWIKNARLMVISSDYEGFSNVLIEALILGTPVVTTAYECGAKEVMTGELSRFLSKIGDPQGLATNINIALSGYPEIPEALRAQFNVTTVAEKCLATFAKHRA